MSAANLNDCSCAFSPLFFFKGDRFRDTSAVGIEEVFHVFDVRSEKSCL